MLAAIPMTKLFSLIPKVKTGRTNSCKVTHMSLECAQVRSKIEFERYLSPLVFELEKKE